MQKVISILADIIIYANVIIVLLFMLGYGLLVSAAIFITPIIEFVKTLRKRK